MACASPAAQRITAPHRAWCNEQVSVPSATRRAHQARGPRAAHHCIFEERALRHVHSVQLRNILRRHTRTTSTPATRPGPFGGMAVQTAAVNRKKGATGGRTRPTTSTAAFAAPTTSTTSTTRPTTSTAASDAPTHLHGLRARPVLYVEELREVGEQVVRHRCQHDRERAERGEREDRTVEAHCVSAKRPASERASHHQLLC